MQDLLVYSVRSNLGKPRHVLILPREVEVISSFEFSFVDFASIKR